MCANAAVGELQDLLGDLTLLNWAAVVVFAGVAVASHLQRRQARHTEWASPE